MKILEFGDASKRKIILIHGFQSPWKVWEEYIEHYEKDFHVIVPIMPGHDPETKEDFISFDQTAEELEDYMISCYGEAVYAVCGMSMGGVLTATLWQNRRLRFEKVIFDGSPLVSINGIMKTFMLRFYLDITHKSQRRDKATLEQAVKSIITKEKLSELLLVLDNMSDVTISNSINSIAAFKLKSDIDTPDTRVYFFHGTAPNEMLARKSAKYVLKHYPTSVVKCFKGKAHCENSLFQPALMIKELDAVLL